MDTGQQLRTGPALVEVRRSARRRRTVSAYRDGDRTVVLVPAGLPAAEERHWVEELVGRLERRVRRRTSDQALAQRAARLRARHVPEAAAPTSVRWASDQRTRWGSCTPADGTIRISARLARLPPWVLDYVLVHELAHLVVPGHDERFWRIVGRYPRAERARGFLEGVAAAGGATPEVD